MRPVPRLADTSLGLCPQGCPQTPDLLLRGPRPGLASPSDDTDAQQETESKSCWEVLVPTLDDSSRG